MPLVASVDYVARRIHLSADSVGVDLDTLDVYREVRALRRTTEAHRKFRPMIEGGGNIEKIVGLTYTPAYARLLNGCLIIPYDQSQLLRLVRDTFTDDGRAGRDCFDRTTLSPGVVVDIDVDIAEVEIRVVTVSGANVITGDIADVADAVVAKSLGARSLGAHIQAIAATTLGETTGAGTSHMAFTDGPVTVEADVPLPGVDGDRTNVVITGV